ncbi:MAG: hypothetical protein MZU97_11665 [Bacillus subtilis]|nr:hypothetical protein [Bacillus subtilis]
MKKLALRRRRGSPKVRPNGASTWHRPGRSGPGRDDTSTATRSISTATVRYVSGDDTGRVADREQRANEGAGSRHEQERGRRVRDAADSRIGCSRSMSIRSSSYVNYERSTSSRYDEISWNAMMTSSDLIDIHSMTRMATIQSGRWAAELPSEDITMYAIHAFDLKMILEGTR